MTSREGVGLRSTRWAEGAYAPALIGILVVGAALRFFRLDAQSIWHDEAWSVVSARMSLGDMIRMLSTDVHPPTYYLALKPWMAVFGSSATAIRTPSALAGVAGIGAVYVFAKDLFDKRTALIAAAILAVSPYHIWYSQEARVYSLLFLFSVLSMHAYWLAFVARPSTKSTAYYVATTVILLYLHFFGVFVLFAQAVHFAGHRLRWGRNLKAAGSILPAALVVGLCYLPLGLLTLQQVRTRAAEGFWLPEPNAATLLNTFTVFAGDYDVAPTWVEVGQVGLLSALFLLLVMNASVPFTLDRLNRVSAPDRWPRVGLLAALGVSLVVLPFVISRISVSIYYYQVIIGALAALIIGAAIGLARIRSTYLRASLVVLLVVATISPLRLQYMTSSKEEWRELVPRVEASARPGATIALYKVEGHAPFQYYSRRRDLKLVAVGYERDDLFPEVDGVPSAARLAKRVADEPDVWLILSHVEDGDPLVARLLRRLGKPSEDLRFLEVRALRFTR